MITAIDGACKRNGEPNCVSVGVAWIETDDGAMFFESTFEHQSTSQRGELNGLMNALKAGKEYLGEDEDLIIITDSEYMFNTIDKDWLHKWQRAGWIGGQGDTVKNVDMWQQVVKLVDEIGMDRIMMQWTKGHLVHYTDGNIKKAMNFDPSGVELFMRIRNMADRPIDRARIEREFAEKRAKHGHLVPPKEQCFDWAVANATADALASYVVKTFDDLLI